MSRARSRTRKAAYIPYVRRHTGSEANTQAPRRSARPWRDGRPRVGRSPRHQAGTPSTAAPRRRAASPWSARFSRVPCARESGARRTRYPRLPVRQVASSAGDTFVATSRSRRREGQGRNIEGKTPSVVGSSLKLGNRRLMFLCPTYRFSRQLPADLSVPSSGVTNATSTPRSRALQQPVPGPRFRASTRPVMRLTVKRP